ncbi:MAG: HDOD domain-containing protein [Gammaproteobacteria bacterium]|nr:HDOD domain-containing protein [Gammaproteobacteria bacterium]
MAIELANLERNIEKIPPLSEAVNEAIALFSSGQVDYDLIEQKVSQDPSLTARILKVANSSFYGFSGKISSIKHASMILGMHATRNIIISAGVMENLQKSHAGGVDFELLWHHSASTGAIARILAKSVGIGEAEAFTAGLLHDIGIMVLDIYFPEDYEKVLNYQRENGVGVAEAEEAVLGFNHSQVGAIVAAYWKLPELIINSCEYHHNPLADEASQYAQIIFLANNISHNVQDSNRESIELEDEEGEVAYALALSDGWVEPLLTELAEMNGAESLLS